MSQKYISSAGLRSITRLNMISLRYLFLAFLTLQTTTIIVLYSYSKQVGSGSSGRYLSTTVVVIAELFKLIFSTLILYKDSGYSTTRCLNLIHQEVFCNMRESIKVLLPASLYALQNNLAFFALSNLDPATYQVAYQLKIITTAIFSVLIVGKTVRRKQWIAVFMLFIGVSMVQIPHNTHESGDGAKKNRLLGFLSIVVCCSSSGFSGVYFERLIKSNPKQPLWIRNFQMSFYCMCVSICLMLYQDYSNLKAGGLLQGYNSLTWSIVILQSLGGILVANVIKHADNIEKSFATSISIILSLIASYCIFDNFNPSIQFFFGALIVIFSTIMYST